MALTSLQSHLFLVCLFTSIFLVQSRLDLHPSDHDALLHIHRDFGIQPAPERNLCNSTGIFCERRMINNSYVLRITRLVFKSQHLVGKISPAIGVLSELKELSLPNNQLSGQIPAQIIGCQNLEILNIGKNQFSGEFPPGLSSLIRLRVLELSSNKFTGNLKFLKYFPNLEKINLADNMFAGKVPISLKSFRNLRFINISGNSLLEEGQLLLMNNQLDQYITSELTEKESIPKRYILAEISQGRNQSTSAMVPSSGQASNAEAPSTVAAPKRKHKKRKKKVVEWILGFLAGAIAGSGSGLVFSLLYKLIMWLIRGRRTDTSLKIFSSLIKKPEDLAFLEAMGKKSP